MSLGGFLLQYTDLIEIAIHGSRLPKDEQRTSQKLDAQSRLL
jgi:hypothetical protein